MIFLNNTLNSWSQTTQRYTANFVFLQLTALIVISYTARQNGHTTFVTFSFTFSIRRRRRNIIEFNFYIFKEYFDDGGRVWFVASRVEPAKGNAGDVLLGVLGLNDSTPCAVSFSLTGSLT